jgi:hypothetical protein
MQDPIMHSKIKTTASGGLFFDSVLNFESSPVLEERRCRRWIFRRGFVVGVLSVGMQLGVFCG